LLLRNPRCTWRSSRRMDLSGTSLALELRPKSQPKCERVVLRALTNVSHRFVPLGLSRSDITRHTSLTIYRSRRG